MDINADSKTDRSTVQLQVEKRDRQKIGRQKLKIKYTAQTNK